MATDVAVNGAVDGRARPTSANARRTRSGTLRSTRRALAPTSTPTLELAYNHTRTCGRKRHPDASLYGALPHLRRDLGLPLPPVTPAISAPGLRSPPPYLHRVGTELVPATSLLGLGSLLPTSAPRFGSPLPHASHICAATVPDWPSQANQRAMLAPLGARPFIAMVCAPSRTEQVRDT
jgi:hypothetical protein